MLIFKRGSMFSEEAMIYVNTVNCVGVMGKGVALEFKNKYPRMYKEYKDACALGKILPGTVWDWTPNKNKLNSIPIILNMATKDHWRNPSKLEWVREGLRLTREYLKINIPEWYDMAMPKIGCGLGGLKWVEVKLEIVNVLGNLKHEIRVYE